MNTNYSASTLTKKKICESLLYLMEREKYEDITIFEICEEAYVGKTTFYRYFKSKDDVLSYALVNGWVEWCNAHNVKETRRFEIENIEKFFDFTISISHFLALIAKNSLGHIVQKGLLSIIGEEKSGPDYEVSFFSYGLFGILKEWWDNGHKESAKEMTEIFHSFYNK